MKDKLLYLIKLLTICAQYALLVPFLVAFMLIVEGKISQHQIWIQLLFIEITGLLAYFSTGALFKLKLKPVFINIISATIGLSCVTAYVLLCTNIFERIFFGVVCVIAYYLGAKGYTVSYKDMLTTKKFHALNIINFIEVCMIMIFLRDSATELAVMILPYLFFVTIYFLASNQANIDFLMERRHHSLANLPAKIRYYNFFLIFAVCGIILIGYLFRNYIGDAIMYILSVIKSVIAFLLSLMRTTSDMTEHDMQTIEDKGDQFGPGESDSLGGMIITIVLIIAAIIFLIYNRKSIIPFIKKCWHTLANFISEKLYSLFNFLKALLLKLSIVQKLRPTGSDEYIDELQKISSQKDEELQRKKIKNNKHQWKKEFNEFCKSTGALKVRLGYKLILRALFMRNVKLNKSDTTCEIKQKSGERVKDIENITQVYDAVRYGEKEPTSVDIEWIKAAVDGFK